MYLVILDRSFNRAAVLVGMRAIGKATMREIGSELRKIGIEVGLIDPPEFELSQAWSINDVSASLNFDQFSGGGGMSPFCRPVRDTTDSELETRLDCIQERAFSHTTLARNCG